MDLDLDAVSRALERLVGPSYSENSSTHLPRDKSRLKSSRGFDSRNIEDSKSRSNAGLTVSKISIDSKNGTQEVLVPPNKPKHHPRQQSKTLVRFPASPNQLLCKVVEASGVGASSVMMGSNSASKRHEEKVWSINLYQSPNPYVILNCLPRHFFRKENLSYVAPTPQTQGVRKERLRDVMLRLAIDPVTDDHASSEECEAVIEHVVVSCSNHPRTGYVNVVRVKNIEGPVIQAVLPGTLMGPFLKITLFPKDTLRMKVLRVGLIEVSHAESWTERCIIEEPLQVEEEFDGDEEDHDLLPAAQSEHLCRHSIEAPINEKKEKKIKSLPAPQPSASVSSVCSVDEDEGSIVETQVTHKKYVQGTGTTFTALVPNAVKEPAAPITLKDTSSLQSGRRKKPKHVEDNFEGEVPVSSKLTKKTLISPTHVTSCVSVPLKSPKNEESDNVRDPRSSSSATTGSQAVVAADSSFNEGHNAGSVSKALIAWGIKRRLLQDKSIMRFLRENREGSHDVPSSSELGKKSSHSVKSCSVKEFEDSQKSYQLLQARGAWESAVQRRSRDALLEAMRNSTAFCLTIARTHDEVLASLPQPYALQILLVLSDTVPSEQDCFDLMMIIARGERRRGREAELLCRLTNGFGCVLHPRHHVDARSQQILVSVITLHTQVNEWLLEAFRLHGVLYPNAGPTSSLEQETKSAEVPVIKNDDHGLPFAQPSSLLRSVLDFSSLFDSILPALRPWLNVSSLHYYGDVQPIFHPFVNECGVIHPTSWFQCILQGTVRSVLLSLPGANEATSVETPIPTVQRRLVCAVLHRHVPLCAVWQPQPQAVKVVLCTAHALHHIDLLDGLLMDNDGLEEMEALLPHSRSKIQLIEDSSLLHNSGSALGYAPSITKETLNGLDSASPLAFQVLGTALRHSWSVVGIVLPSQDSMRVPLNEDAFMDTVLRWGYALPRAVVLFRSDAPGDSGFSVELLEAFAPVNNIQSALA